MWTRFSDNYSGGVMAEPPYERIYIEAPFEEARAIFYNRFSHDPEWIGCPCCGKNYSADEHESIHQLSGRYRGCRWLAFPRYKTGEKKGRIKPWSRKSTHEQVYFHHHYYLEDGELPMYGFEVDSRSPKEGYLTLNEYMQKPGVLFIPKNKIKPGERIGPVPEQEILEDD